MLKFRIAFLRSVFYSLLLAFSIPSVSAQGVSHTAIVGFHFPKPDPLNFKPNEIAVIDSFINLYLAPKNFYGDMIRFAKDDSLNSRTQFDVVFTGSSSFTKWKSLPEDMAPLPALNRGFGASKVMDLVYFSTSYLYKLQPKLVYVYVENDITLPSTKQIILLFRYLEEVYHSNLPKTKIIFCGIKKSISRKTHWLKADEVNTYLESSLSKRRNCAYLEMNAALLNKSGLPNGEYFLSDSLHLNEKGYEKWIEVVKPCLQKEYTSGSGQKNSH